MLTARRDWAVSPTEYDWRLELSETESLARLPDGSVAVVAPWPPGSGDGTYYPPENDSVPRDPPSLPTDPYRHSADPDGSMAAEEALHNVGPFDPRYPGEYLPDPWADDPTGPEDPPPKADTSDPIEPSDNEPVAEVDPLDALIDAEAVRSDQIVALLGVPRATDALGRRIPVRLVINHANTIEVRFEPALAAAFPLTATSRITFNPDALP